jgi:hypothetical protein
MFRHYCVILREFGVSTLQSHTKMSLQSLVIRFKISHNFKIIKILKHISIHTQYVPGQNYDIINIETVHTAKIQDFI